jgi:hypothetical protein
MERAGKAESQGMEGGGSIIPSEVRDLVREWAGPFLGKVPRSLRSLGMTRGRPPDGGSYAGSGGSPRRSVPG